MTEVAYKLTDCDGYTRRGLLGETLWSVGATVSPTGVGTDPCGPGVLHAYVAPEVGLLANPIHADIHDPRIFRVSGRWETDGLKRWTYSPVEVLEEVELPALSRTELVAWAIILAPHPTTRTWAVAWLSGDRAAEAAAAAGTAAEAAWAAAWEAWVAAWAAEAAEAAEAAAVWAARAAWAAAWAWAAVGEAAWAAEAAEAAEAAAWAWAAVGEEKKAAEARLMPALARARAILAGEFPAEKFDDPL